jgi:aminoglycoside phosphotransferase family enzyme
VFIFEDMVYKVYKNDNEFFNKGFRDLSDKAARFDFTRRDFEWNHSLSPSIYLHLAGVSVVDDRVRLGEPTDDAQELFFVMHRIKSDDVLFEKLMRGEVSRDEAFLMGKQLAEALEKKSSTPPPGHNLFHIFERRVTDLRGWISQVTEHISETESGEYCDFLEAFRHKHRKTFEEALTQEIEHEGDMHSHNAVFTDNVLYLMDTFPPKEEWLVGHALVPLYRIGVDIWALSGDQDLFEAFVEGYEKGSGKKVDRNLDAFFMIYAASIMVSYLYMLQRTDAEKKEAAQRFHKFIREYYKSVAGCV